ncbi:MAG: DUF6869 domain-containing protein [Pseudomonadota bacterium]
MNSKSFENEYQRVLARSDLSEMRRTLKSAARFVRSNRKLLDEDPHDQGFGEIYEPDDPERLLAFSILAMAEFDDPHLIGLIAAGPLEDIFMFSAIGSEYLPPADPDLIENLLVRIEDEARKTARFRWMLSGVWTTSFKPDHAKRIETACAGASLEDTLPPRPWA